MTRALPLLAATIILAVALAGPVAAQTDTVPPETTSTTTTIQLSTPAPVSSLPPATTTSEPSAETTTTAPVLVLAAQETNELADTGLDPAALFGLGLALLAVGGAAVVGARRVEAF